MPKDIKQQFADWLSHNWVSQLSGESWEPMEGGMYRMTVNDVNPELVRTGAITPRSAVQIELDREDDKRKEHHTLVVSIY